MLHAYFQNHRPSGSGEEVFLFFVFFKVFAIYSHGGHLGHVTLIIYLDYLYKLSFSLPKNAPHPHEVWL